MVTYFHKVPVGTDLEPYRLIHQQQFPGNDLAILKAEDGELFVKVTYPDFTVKPEGAYTEEEMRPLLKVESTFG